MKLNVTHDRSGKITALVACSGPSEATCSVSRPGQHVSQIEFSEIEVDLDPKQIIEHLAKLLKSRKVELKGNNARIVPIPKRT